MKTIFAFLLAILTVYGCGATKKAVQAPNDEPTYIQAPMIHPSAPARPAPAPKQEVFVAMEYEPVYFDFDKYNIRQDQRTKLAGYADVLQNDAGVNVVISGHCDERGTVEYNLALGQRRAESAKSYLVQSGISGDRIRTVSYGEGRPVDSGHNETAWAHNRRAEIAPER